MEANKTGWYQVRRRLFNMVSVGVVDDRINQGYDIISTLLLILNLAAAFLSTYDSIQAAYASTLQWIEAVTVFFFAIDYVLRLLTAGLQFPRLPEGKALLRYIFSGYGIIDLLSFLPYYLPFFFPISVAAFRFFRVVRIFRLFRINAYYDSLSVISSVIVGKRNQLIASIFIIFTLMMASSLSMYSIEHAAQPDVFKNAFSGLWWATSTLLTVGYGDIYPITTMGQVMGIIITFLGVGLVAIPTGIISAGFVEEYQKFKKLADVQQEENVRFIEVPMKASDKWVGKQIRELGMPQGTIIAVIIRDRETIVPRGNVVIEAGDLLIICAESVKDDYLTNIKEIFLKKSHTWNGLRIKELNISRQTFIILVERDGRMLIPHGDLILERGDKILLYTKENINRYRQEARF